MTTATPEQEAAEQSAVAEEQNADESTQEQGSAGSEELSKLKDRLERWNASRAEVQAELDAFQDPEGADAEEFKKKTQSMNLWNGRINKLISEIEEFEENPAAAAEKKASTSSRKKGGLPKCPVTGVENKPGSRFKPGQDAKLKGLISRSLAGAAKESDRIPALAIEYANTIPDQMYVGDYTAQDILRAHQMQQDGTAFKPKKEDASKDEAEKETA